MTTMLMIAGVSAGMMAMQRGFEEANGEGKLEKVFFFALGLACKVSMGLTAGIAGVLVGYAAGKLVSKMM